MNLSRRLAIACTLTIFGSLLFGAVVGGKVHIETRYFIYTLPLFFLAVAAVVKKVGDVK
jgi:hypothetical protein